MDSPPFQGINGNLFLTTPTLLKTLKINAPSYHKERERLLNKKTTPTLFDPNLREYQNQDVGFLLSLKNKAIFNQQRTGKTPTTLTTMKINNENNALIICPSSILFKWNAEYNKWHQGPVEVIHNQMTIKKRREIINNFHGTIITSYGLVRNELNNFIKRKPHTIVIDEAHRLRNYKGARNRQSPQMAKAIIQLSRLAESRYALTGTPTPNKPENIYGILTFLFPHIFTSYWNFIEYYFHVKDTIIDNQMNTIKDIIGFKNKNKERELQEWLEIISIQRKRIEVMPWVNEIKYETIWIPPNQKQLKYLKELNEFYEIEEEELVTISILDRLIREQQIAIEPKMLDLNCKGVKTTWIQEYLQDYPEKSIIFISKFTSYLKYLKEHVIKDATLLIGETSEKQRYEIEQAFNDKKINTILANVDVAKEGMTLYGADTMVFIDTSLTYTDNEQCMDRLLPVSEAIAKEKGIQEIILLMTKTPIEEYLYQMFKLKKSRTDILNNYKKYLMRRA